MKKADFALAFILVMSFAVGAFANEVPVKVGENEAFNLVLMGGEGATRNSLDYQKGMSGPGNENFYIFDGLSTCHGCQGSYGFFAVNKWTGDVWVMWGCYKEKTRALRKAQAAIKRRFTSAELRDYLQLSRLEPECTVDDRDK